MKITEVKKYHCGKLLQMPFISCHAMKQYHTTVAKMLVFQLALRPMYTNVCKHTELGIHLTTLISLYFKTKDLY
jgi:hypothetical protein